MKKYPKEVVVFLENEGEEDEYLGVFDSIENVACIGEPRRVAVYSLKETVTVEAEVRVKK